jgi:putative phosphoribosyl transferase
MHAGTQRIAMRSRRADSAKDSRLPALVLWGGNGPRFSMIAQTKIRFRDRTDAGRYLARQLERYANRGDVMVLGLPRGGVPVAYEVAMHLGAPLDVFVVRKLGVPGHEELAMGAIASGGVRVLNDDVVRWVPNAKAVIEAATAEESAELLRRERLYRDDRPAPDVRGKAVILVDDGLATGATMLAAVRALRQMEAAAIVMAVPVGSRDRCRAFESEVDEVVCATTPADFHAVGQFYDDFSQTTDEEVRSILVAAARRP